MISRLCNIKINDLKKNFWVSSIVAKFFLKIFSDKIRCNTIYVTSNTAASKSFNALKNISFPPLTQNYERIKPKFVIDIKT